MDKHIMVWDLWHIITLILTAKCNIFRVKCALLVSPRANPTPGYCCQFSFLHENRFANVRNSIEFDSDHIISKNESFTVISLTGFLFDNSSPTSQTEAVWSVLPKASNEADYLYLAYAGHFRFLIGTLKISEN